MKDPEEITDAHWQTVVQMIKSGGYDDRLDELEEVERSRGSTRSSVIKAIESRRDQT